MNKSKTIEDFKCGIINIMVDKGLFNFLESLGFKPYSMDTFEYKYVCGLGRDKFQGNLGNSRVISTEEFIKRVEEEMRKDNVLENIIQVNMKTNQVYREVGRFKNTNTFYKLCFSGFYVKSDNYKKWTPLQDVSFLERVEFVNGLELVEYNEMEAEVVEAKVVELTISQIKEALYGSDNVMIKVVD